MSVLLMCSNFGQSVKVKFLSLKSKSNTAVCFRQWISAGSALKSICLNVNSSGHGDVSKRPRQQVVQGVGCCGDLEELIIFLRLGTNFTFYWQRNAVRCVSCQ